MLGTVPNFVHAFVFHLVSQQTHKFSVIISI